MNILLAENEKDLSRALNAILTHNGYTVTQAYDGEEAYNYATDHVYDLFVFDIMMPKMDGVEVLKKLRDQDDQTPALFLTAKAELDDRVTGLDAGADDYLTKPFEMKELIARIRALIRRHSLYKPKSIRLGNVTLDTEIGELRQENAIRLANKETKLMQYLMINVGKDISLDNIFEHVWNDDEDPSIVWVYINYLRSKLTAIDALLEIRGGENGPFRLTIEGGSGDS